jgi:hypothetical protein
VLSDASDGEFSVTFQENAHVMDETGQIGCSTEGLRAPATFCKEPIEVDKLLGTEAGEDDEQMVHAFNFWCRLR